MLITVLPHVLCSLLFHVITRNALEAAADVPFVSALPAPVLQRAAENNLSWHRGSKGQQEDQHYDTMKGGIKGFKGAKSL